MNKIRLSTRGLLLLIGALLLVGCTSTSSAEAPQPPAHEEGPGSAVESPFAEDELSFTGFDIVNNESLVFRHPLDTESPATLETLIEAYNHLYVEPILEQEPIAYNTLLLEGQSLFIDFEASIYRNLSSSVEAALLEPLFQAYFDNIPKLNRIYVTVNQGPYESGHYLFLPEEPIEPEDFQ